MANPTCYVAKFRLSDGAVVDVWSGPSEVPEHNANGPVYAGEKKDLGFWAKKALFLKPEPKMIPQMCHPTTVLVSAQQGAVEISEAQFKGLGSLTEANGRLRWKVVAGKLVPNEGPLFTSGKPITDAPAVNKGTLHMESIGQLSLGKGK